MNKLGSTAEKQDIYCVKYYNEVISHETEKMSENTHKLIKDWENQLLDNVHTPTDNELPYNTIDEQSDLTLITEIKIEELNKVLKSVKSNTATGTDKIPNKILKSERMK